MNLDGFQGVDGLAVTGEGIAEEKSDWRKKGQSIFYQGNLGIEGDKLISVFEIYTADPTSYFVIFQPMTDLHIRNREPVSIIQIISINECLAAYTWSYR